MSKPKKLLTYAQQFASKGGKARMGGLSNTERKTLASDAAKARWAKAKAMPANAQ